MIAYALLLYIGVKIAAPFWYFVMIGLGVIIKMCAACINVAAKS